MADETVHPNEDIATRWVGDMLPVRVLDGAGAGTTMDEGWVLGYLASPSILLLHADGTSASWSTSLPWQITGDPTPPERQAELVAGMHRRSRCLPAGASLDEVYRRIDACDFSDHQRYLVRQFAGWAWLVGREAADADALETASLSPPAAVQAKPVHQDTDEPAKCACADCHELLPDDWTHGAYCGQCIIRCEPDEPKPPAGLSAEQEIRKAAAELWLQDGFEPPRWKLGDWCAWIRDGRTPDEARPGPGFADAFIPEDLRPAGHLPADTDQEDSDG